MTDLGAPMSRQKPIGRNYRVLSRWDGDMLYVIDMRFVSTLVKPVPNVAPVAPMSIQFTGVGADVPGAEKCDMM